MICLELQRKERSTLFDGNMLNIYKAYCIIYVNCDAYVFSLVNAGF